MEQPSTLHPWYRRWFGSRSERAARRYLRRHGHQILKCNWQSSSGEIDLITLHHQTIVFVEVRSTEQPTTERPAFSVDERKQKQLSHLAVEFMHRYRLLAYPARFDVILISWPSRRWWPVIEHLPNAFSAKGQFAPFS